MELAKPELENGAVTFQKASESIRQLFAGAELSEELVGEITGAYAALSRAARAVALRPVRESQVRT